MTKTDLLPFQIPAVEKLQPLRVGALFMDMGLGKSRAAIELVARRQEKISRVVWFCPVSLKETIEFEIHKHVDTESHPVYVFDDKTHQGAIPRAFWYVIGLESMGSSSRVILAARDLMDESTCVIVDESDFIKGHRSQRTWWVTEISKNTRYRLILSGTSVTQGIVDLYAQFRFLSPLILGYRSFYSFAANHLEYSEKYPGLIVRSLNTGYIAAKIAPFTYQVTKDECLTLPKKLYETRYFGMTPQQEMTYQQAKYELLMDVDPDEMNSWVIFRLFTALQQIVCGFWNRRPPRENRRDRPEMEHIDLPHYRLEVLQDVLARIPGDEKVIIWAKFDYDVQGIMGALNAHYGASQVSLFCGKNAATRDEELERFRGPARFLVATPSSGGRGLTVNDARFMVFYNNGFKYSERKQAADRNYRIGQDMPVTIIDIICNAGIDLRIMDALATKQGVVQSFRREVKKLREMKDEKKFAELVASV